MQLSTLVADLQDEINKGSSVTDTQIRRHIQHTYSLLEMKHSWAYMDRFVTFTIDLGSENPRVLPFPSRVKSFEFVRLIDPTDSTGTFIYLNEISPRDITKVEAGVPAGYFKDGVEYLWMDNTPQVAYNGEISYRRFTEWSDDDAFEPWLMAYASPLVKYQALCYASPFVRELELRKVYEKDMADALKATLDMNEEFEYSNQSMQMGYGH